jgi:hypothetical protein
MCTVSCELSFLKSINTGVNDWSEGGRSTFTIKKIVLQFRHGCSIALESRQRATKLKRKRCFPEGLQRTPGFEM